MANGYTTYQLLLSSPSFHSFFPADPFEILVPFTKALISELEARFEFTIPDPELEHEAYFPYELIASALDIRTKKLTFISETDREKVNSTLSLLL